MFNNVSDKVEMIKISMKISIHNVPSNAGEQFNKFNKNGTPDLPWRYIWWVVI